MVERATVLVVEDELDAREMAMAVIEEASLTALGAASAPAAIAMMNDHAEIDLLFTDVVMPGIDGFMLADMAKVRLPQLKVLYVTGYHDVARSKPGILHGPLMLKPYDATRLTKQILAALCDAPRPE